MENYLWLIPVLPLIGAVINLLIGRHLPRPLVHLLACGAILASFILSAVVFFDLLKLPPDERIIRDMVYTWLSVGNLNVQFALLIDPLSIIMLLVVSGVGFLIHVYSVGYMHGDPRYSRFFGYMNLFTFAMLLLVSADNLLLMFVGWEGVGLCSYLLIGFWFEKKANAVAGMKAFIVNRIGDAGFIIGIMLLFWSLGSIGNHWTVSFLELKQHIHLLTPGLATAIALLLFVGAAGKSAQIPLYVWLPDAMAGPTPVSALIHAATMVTAGVYMIARMHFLYLLAPAAMMVVAIIAVATAFYAGTMALMQKDIKKILAYSTISQLGYMFLGVGVGAFVAGIFHLMTHAFFKALLFLGAGSVMHGTGNQTDIHKMGGLRKYMPITFCTFLIATLAITGIPLFSGFFSKDEILWKAYSNGHWILWVVGVAGAGLTSLYMFRLLFLTFFGQNRASAHDDKHDSGHHAPAHESPLVMTVPLMILAVLAVVGGYVGIPLVLGGYNHIEHFMEPVFASAVGHAVTEHAPAHSLEFILMIVSVVVVFGGILLAYYFYIKRPDLPGKLAQRFKRIHQFIFNKYYIDELYHLLFVRSLLGLNKILAFVVDQGIIDWLVNASGKSTVGASDASGWVDNTFVDGAVNGTASTVGGMGQAVRGIQTGRLKHYLAWVTGGAVIIVIVFYFIMK